MRPPLTGLSTLLLPLVTGLASTGSGDDSAAARSPGQDERDWRDRYGTFGILPADATAVTFRSFITGHGWNNSQNCAEFCAKEHFFTIGGGEGGSGEGGREVRRDDCAETETDGTQQGTWRTSRAGWCPGAQVYPWDTDVSDSALAGSPVATSDRLEDFTWAGDGDQPYDYLSGVYLVYR